MLLISDIVFLIGIGTPLFKAPRTGDLVSISNYNVIQHVDADLISKGNIDVIYNRFFIGLASRHVCLITRHSRANQQISRNNMNGDVEQRRKRRSQALKETIRTPPLKKGIYSHTSDPNPW